MITFSQLGNKGRLGNQLFQIAATIGMAKYNNQNWVFPDWEYQSYFKHQLPLGHLRNCKIFKEDAYVVNMELDTTSNWDLDGYFQGSAYFYDCDYIRSIFQPTDDLVAYIDTKYGSILEGNTCSIHVRRGDYLKLNKFYALPTMKYYKKAIGKFENTQFLVFSDDIEWCKQNFEGENFIFIEGEKDVVDLILMTRCKNNIMANSSFSWWGAWLNPNKDKKVICPGRWYNYRISPNAKKESANLYNDSGFEKIYTQNIFARWFQDVTDPIRYRRYTKKMRKRERS